MIRIRFRARFRVRVGILLGVGCGLLHRYSGGMWAEIYVIVISYMLFFFS